jgi:hypothetical protein
MTNAQEKRSVTGPGFLLLIAALLLPAIAGIVCGWYSTVASDRGLFYFWTAISIIPALVGFLAAIATALIASITRRITGGLLISAWLIIVIMGIVWYFAIQLPRNPFV